MQYCYRWGFPLKKQDLRLWRFNIRYKGKYYLDVYITTNCYIALCLMLIFILILHYLSIIYNVTCEIIFLNSWSCNYTPTFFFKTRKYTEVKKTLKYDTLMTKYVLLNKQSSFLPWIKKKPSNETLQIKKCVYIEIFQCYNN